MNQKDLIKYGLLALGAYLVWKYIEDHGGISAVLGTSTGATPGTQPVAGSLLPYPVSTQPSHTDTIQPTNTPPKPPALDTTGLVLTPDINGSFTGTVKINGVPTQLSVIAADGRVFDTSGAEVTSSLQAAGVDLSALRAAFAPDYSKGTFINGTWSSFQGLGTVRAPWLN